MTATAPASSRTVSPLVADETPGRVAATLAYYRERGERESAAARDVVTRHSGENILTLVAAIEAALKLADEAIPALGAIHCTCAGNGADDTCRCPERPVAWTLDPAKLRETIGAALTGTQPSEDGSDRG